MAAANRVSVDAMDAAGSDDVIRVFGVITNQKFEPPCEPRARSVDGELCERESTRADFLVTELMKSSLKQALVRPTMSRRVSSSASIDLL